MLFVVVVAARTYWHFLPENTSLSFLSFFILTSHVKEDYHLTTRNSFRPVNSFKKDGWLSLELR